MVQAGFISGQERRTLSAADLATASTTTFLLCPYDRAECRGRLMALTYLPAAGVTAVLGFRSMPFWQDLPISDGSVDVARARENLAGAHP